MLTPITMVASLCQVAWASTLVPYPPDSLTPSPLLSILTLIPWPRECQCVVQVHGCPGTKLTATAITWDLIIPSLSVG